MKKCTCEPRIEGKKIQHTPNCDLSDWGSRTESLTELILREREIIIQEKVVELRNRLLQFQKQNNDDNFYNHQRYCAFSDAINALDDVFKEG